MWFTVLGHFFVCLLSITLVWSTVGNTQKPADNSVFMCIQSQHVAYIHAHIFAYFCVCGVYTQEVSVYIHSCIWQPMPTYMCMYCTVGLHFGVLEISPYKS